jgi:UDP-2-acetamido-2,6-beta-L-arabino-hexul-4-ose reductase
MMRVLITGANGFLGKNLCLWLRELHDIEVVHFTRANDPTELSALVMSVDFIFHLAGINRPQDPGEFFTGNADLTDLLVKSVFAVATHSGKKIPIVFASSTQAEQDNPYGMSKRAAEETLFSLQREYNVPVHIYRLPNVFGKWARPNYNSAVSTFCHNIARGLPIQIHDPNAQLTLVYVDDVVRAFIGVMDGEISIKDDRGFSSGIPSYQTAVGELARLIEAFHTGREDLRVNQVGGGLQRALYATYVSYLPPAQFAYAIPQHVDTRGIFVEMLKTRDSGQFSFFTAHPGVTRGGHYHHTKSEKFLVIQGEAHFKFRHMYTGETHQIITNGTYPKVVDTVPGWTHDITNIGENDLIVILWANETFDHDRPDTYACQL